LLNIIVESAIAWIDHVNSKMKQILIVGFGETYACN